MWGFPIGKVILCSGLHFGLGFGVGLLVGLLVWRLMLTTSLRITASDTWKGQFGRIDRSIFLWLSLLVVSLSIVVHVLEDYLLGYF